MKVVLYEWCCSGGLAGCGAADELDGLAAEGRAMLEALAADAVREPGIDVTVLVDPAMPIEMPGAVRTMHVRGDDVAALVAAAHEADWSVVVAPETGGILRSRAGAVQRGGGRVLGPSGAFIEIASDKQFSIESLASAGLPVPAGRSLAAGEPIPAAFWMPAVVKDRDGAGGAGCMVLHRPDGRKVARATRLEAFAEGTPVGVSVLCGPSGLRPLPPMRQRFTSGDRPVFVGVEPLEEGELVERAATMACRAIRAVERSAARIGGGAAIGWVGVDMILGRAASGRDDRVLEVNPRITSSFVGLSAASDGSLVRAMLDHAAGRSGGPPRFPPATRSTIPFNTDST